MSYPKGYNRICLTLKGMTRPVVKELKMDKYEYNVKLEQIKKLIKKKDYATAARIADTIDWYKVKNNQTIIMIADVYEASGRYDQSKEIGRAHV